MKQLALTELRRVAERTRIVRVPANRVSSFKFQVSSKSQAQPPETLNLKPETTQECVERIPWKVWYVSASNGDVIRGEECVTLSVDINVNGPGAYPSRLVQFVASGQVRRLRDCCILRADDFELRV